MVAGSCLATRSPCAGNCLDKQCYLVKPAMKPVTQAHISQTAPNTITYPIFSSRSCPSFPSFVGLRCDCNECIMPMHTFSQTTCEGRERSETSEETLVSVGCPAASSQMSWPVTAARADRRAQHWRLIASNEQQCSPQKRMNSGLPQKLQHFNPLWYESPHWKLFGHHIPTPERERGFSRSSVAHSRVRGGIPARLAWEEQPWHCAKHWSRHELPNPAGICTNPPFHASLIF